MVKLKRGGHSPSAHVTKTPNLISNLVQFQVLTMTRKVGRGALLTSNLPQLQNLIKRDPIAYKDEFLQQWNHYDSIRRIFILKPDDDAQAERFRELVTFISHVSEFIWVALSLC